MLHNFILASVPVSSLVVRCLFRIQNVIKLLNAVKNLPEMLIETYDALSAIL